MKTKMRIWLYIGSVIAFVISIFGVIYWYQNRPTEQEIIAEQIIHSFMIAKEMDLQQNSRKHKIFMRGIVWGEYPELTGVDSIFINSQYELDAIYAYAWKYSGYEELYGHQMESNIGLYSTKHFLASWARTLKACEVADLRARSAVGCRDGL